MVMREATVLDRTFAALADPTRRAMVERLAGAGRLAISELAAPFSMSLPAILKHVGVLIDAGLVTRVKRGRTVYCHLSAAPVKTAIAWLRDYESYRPPADPALEAEEPAKPATSRRTGAKPRAVKPAASKRKASEAGVARKAKAQRPSPASSPRSQTSAKSKPGRGKRAASAEPARITRARSGARRRTQGAASPRRRTRR